jgi:hypothetical protein
MPCAHREKSLTSATTLGGELAKPDIVAAVLELQRDGIELLAHSTAVAVR